VSRPICCHFNAIVSSLRKPEEATVKSAAKRAPAS
jgi:hypothetical protein